MPPPKQSSEKSDDSHDLTANESLDLTKKLKPSMQQSVRKMLDTIHMAEDQDRQNKNNNQSEEEGSGAEGMKNKKLSL